MGECREEPWCGSLGCMLCRGRVLVQRVGRLILQVAGAEIQTHLVKNAGDTVTWDEK